MPGATVVLAPIPLARAPLRLLLGPFVLASAGVMAAGAGLLIGGAAGVTLLAAGVMVDVLAIYLLVVLFTLRLNVEVATLRLSWIGGERRYVLSRGAVTRVPLRGPSAAALRPRFGAIGWAMGPAILRRTEQIELVRLARSASVILVPTDRGRLAIAPLSEQQLLTALGAAARVQQRLDEVASRARDLPALAPTGAAHQLGAELLSEAPPAPAPHLLTGIERAILEERLAAERAAALAAAEAERQAGLEAALLASVQAPVEAQAAATLPRRARLRQRTTWRRPAWLSTPALARPQPVDLARSLERLAPFGAASLPLLAAVAVWAAAAVLGRLDLSDAELRPVSLALAASGPLAALGALAARAWYPRLLGLVVVSALAGLVLVGRALLG
jgi:hypothetical protein